jgi:hypothetical protein
MKEMLLTKGKVALVDDEDYKFLIQWKWNFSSTGYAARNGGTYKKRKNIKMHRLIMRATSGMEVDHINGNRLDNRRCNLRICTRSQNHCNVGLSSRNTSGFKGIVFDYKTWNAKITKNGKRIHLGCFKNKEDAARAYDRAAKELFGEFAKLNFNEEK